MPRLGKDECIVLRIKPFDSFKIFLTKEENMKIKIFLGLTIAVLVVILFFNVLNAAPGGPDEEAGDGGAVYNRHDYRCPDGVREKTTCISGGCELCSPQYCN
jgi:hypothetical protein